MNWCLPSLVNCKLIISEAVSIYRDIIKEMKKPLHTGLTLSLQIEQKSTKHPKLLITLTAKDVALFFSIELTWLFCLV